MSNILKRIENAAAEEFGELEERIGAPLYPISAYVEVVDAGKLWRGSWQDAAGLAALKGLGIGLVVNLCSERSDAGPVEAAEMKSVWIPLRDNTCPSPAEEQAFIEAVRDCAPVFVHCEAGAGRTGCMVAAYRVKINGWSPSSALEEARKFGLCLPAQVDFIRSLTH